MAKPPATKTAYALKLPYTDALWPVVSADLEKVILNLLVPSLESLPQHHQRVIQRSEQKVDTQKATDLHPQSIDGGTVSTSTRDSSASVSELLTVGYNSTIRTLETLARRSEQRVQRMKQDRTEEREEALAVPGLRPLSAVFVCTAALSEIMTKSLPLLVATASAFRHEDAAIRLVSMSESFATRVAQLLGKARASVFGLCSHPMLEDLELLLREEVRPVDVPWLREAASDRYMPVNILTTEIASNPEKRGTKSKGVGKG